jgi:hypothetical protein
MSKRSVVLLRLKPRIYKVNDLLLKKKLFHWSQNHDIVKENLEIEVMKV